jgi:hypothetical protein
MSMAPLTVGLNGFSAEKTRTKNLAGPHPMSQEFLFLATGVDLRDRLPV